MKRVILLFTVLVFACKNDKNIGENTNAFADKELTELFGLMQGSFNSEAQATRDTTYFNISLHMYPIWKDKGNYLYVEQALNSRQNKPYRQRIYEVKRLSDSTIGSYIYTIKDDSLWVGRLH